MIESGKNWLSVRLKGYYTKIGIFGLDLVFALLSFGIASFLVLAFNIRPYGGILLRGFAVLLALRILSAVFFKSYALIFRYIGEKDYWTALITITTPTLIFGLLCESLPDLFPIMRFREILLIDIAFLLILSIGFRIGLHILISRLSQPVKSRLNTVIFGAGELGSMTLRVLNHDSSHNYKVVAFFDDSEIVHRKYLNGVRVYNFSRSFEDVVKNQDIKVAILAINQLSEERRVAFISACLSHRIKVLKIPPVNKWFGAHLDIGFLDEINYEDLLNRQPIRLDVEAIRQGLNDKVILVTGCAGSIGSEIARQIAGYNPRLIIGLDQAETPLADMTLKMIECTGGDRFLPVIGSVCNRSRMIRLFESHRPDVVFHAAAYKHVPVMELWPEEAVRTNVEGTKVIADLAQQFGVECFVMISTDKAVNPGNVMGASKRIAEIYVSSLNQALDNQTRFITTRFGNVLGSNGSVVPIFQDLIRRRKPITVTHPEVTRYFMTIPEACQLVLEAGTMGEDGEIFVFDMGQQVSIVDLARQMIRMAGLEEGTDIEIRFTGLRPGEKLREELLDDRESLLPTHHPKIMRARILDMSAREIRLMIDALVELTRTDGDPIRVIQAMKGIVPEFVSHDPDPSGTEKQPS